MNKPYERTIHVTQEFFERLEQYLQADERCVVLTPPDMTNGTWNLILITPYGKTLTFKIGK
jgi:hypothetical protein